MKDFFESIQNASKANQKLFARRDLIMNVTEDILIQMEKHEVSKKELARRLGKSKANISQTLDGNRNMTIGTLSDICFELGIKPKIQIGTDANHHPFRKADWRNLNNVAEFVRPIKNISFHSHETSRIQKWA